MAFAVSFRRVLGFARVTRVAVIGGGVAGACTALSLARWGKNVTLFERTRRAHHKVCGEFLSPEGQAVLHRMGAIDDLADGAWIDRVRFSRGNRTAVVDLPFRGFSISRYRLDETLLEKCEHSQVKVLRGRAVRSLQRIHDRWQVNDGGAADEFDHVVLATGKHALRGHPRRGGRQLDYIGFKLNLRLDAESTRRLRGYVDLFFFDGGYAGLELVEDDIATLALIIDRSVFKTRDGRFDHLYARLAHENHWARQAFHGSTWMWRKPLAVARIPYGYVHVPSDRHGPYRVGDQLAVIPSFSGDGMSIALTSGVRCAAAIDKGIDQNQYHRSLHKLHARQVQLAVLLQELAAKSWTQALAMTLIAHAPWLIRRLASWTRAPEPL